MANLIINQDPYQNHGALSNVVNYVLRGNKTFGVIGGQGVLLDDPYSYMELVKNHFCRNEGKQVQHVILTFSETDMPVTTLDAYAIGYDVCALLPDYQIVFGVHQDTGYLHIHWAINPVHIVTGKKLIFGFRESFALRKQVAEILKAYGISCNLRMCGE